MMQRTLRGMISLIPPGVGFVRPKTGVLAHGYVHLEDGFALLDGWLVSIRNGRCEWFFHATAIEAAMARLEGAAPALPPPETLSVEEAILTALKNAPAGASAIALAESCGLNQNSVRGRLNQLRKRGVVGKSGTRDGDWFLIEANAAHPSTGSG